jgi:hypothetical protein
VSDDSGATREQVQVFKRSRLLKTIREAIGASRRDSVDSVRWRVPRTMTGPLRFCVRAWDYSGNRSASSCASLRIR